MGGQARNRGDRRRHRRRLRNEVRRGREGELAGVAVGRPARGERDERFQRHLAAGDDSVWRGEYRGGRGLGENVQIEAGTVVRLAQLRDRSVF